MSITWELNLFKEEHKTHSAVVVYVLSYYNYIIIYEYNIHILYECHISDILGTALNICIFVKTVSSCVIAFSDKTNYQTVYILCIVKFNILCIVKEGIHVDRKKYIFLIEFAAIERGYLMYLKC